MILQKSVISKLFLIASILFSVIVFAEQKSLQIRYVTIKSNQVNARKGPGVNYPIEWVFVKKGEPVKVVSEFEQWRKIQDIDGSGGWVHSSVLSPKRNVIIKSSSIVKLLSKADEKGKIIAKLEPGLRCIFNKCKNSWCQIKCSGYKGWLKAEYLWGLIPNETK
jgi:SH3-like domain-containing protein